MKIYFCDICNESIALTDLKDGRATTIKGKLFCGHCNPLNTVSGGRGSAMRMVGAVLVVLGVGLGTSALVIGWQARGRVAALPEEMGADLRTVRQDLTRVLGSLDVLRGGQQDARAELDQMHKDQGALRQSVSDQGSRLDQDGRSIAEMKTLLTNLRADRELIQSLQLSDGRLEDRMAALGRDMAALEGQLNSLLALPVADAEAATPDEELAPVELDAETRKFVQDLNSNDASIRWNAVDRLASTRNPALVEYLLPLLGDADAFVQYKVIGTLRDWQARPAVSKLIPLLRDGDPIVREEALEALVALTGHPARFDVVDGSASDREKGVKSWEAWYQENRERFEPAS